MKKVFSSVLFLLCATILSAQIDMQAHAGSDEGIDAYDYTANQAAYYTGDFAYENLLAQEGNDLFGTLNTLMGNTSKIGNSSYSYNSLRDAYIKVDVDLNNKGTMIIGYYDGRSMNGK